MNKSKIIINSLKQKETLGDLFGIFFEDINHSADGGLYAELVRNRAFEFSAVDNKSYNPLTAWEKIDSNGATDLYIESAEPVSEKNPHYLVIDIKWPGNNVGVQNTGFNTGIPLRTGEKYLFSCYAKRDKDTDKPITVSLRSENGDTYFSNEVIINSKWKKYEFEIESPKTDYNGRLAITVKGGGKVYLDFVSLFPLDTFNNRKNGMRKDLAKYLADLKSKFLRFPGGCLVHGGSFNKDDRDSMYRWKNTIGAVEERPARRNNWSYHQTLGLGYYEYFLLSEDLGAKPIPVLPAGYNPHFKEGNRAVPLSELQEWIDDALDLIEFANGDTSTVWGKKRAELGHPEPFNLEYLAIGNEEIGKEFFEIYEIVHKAIKNKHPEIKLINTSGPFACGVDYELGWESARKNKSDLVDEHYYCPPEWFLINAHRYDNFKKDDPKVFLGEYASWGHRLYNALAEAAYMIMLEKNAHAVSLACYAPLFCNTDYVNWSTNLIWYDNHRSYGTTNYYVQKLFMNHQGDYSLDITGEGLEKIPVKPEPVTGSIGFLSERSEADFYDVCLINDETGEEKELNSCSVDKDNREAIVYNTDWTNYTISFKAKKICDIPAPEWMARELSIIFGRKDEKNGFVWSIGGKSMKLREKINGGDFWLTEKAFNFEQGKEFNCKLKVSGRHIEAFINDEKRLEAESKPLQIEPLYYTASKDAGTGDIIVKVVNISDKDRTVTLDINGIANKTVQTYTLSGDLDDKNSFDEPEKIIPVEKTFFTSEPVLDYEFKKHSLNVLRFINKRL